MLPTAGVGFPRLSSSRNLEFARAAVGGENAQQFCTSTQMMTMIRTTKTKCPPLVIIVAREVGRKAFRNKRHVQVGPKASCKALVAALMRQDGNPVSSLDYYCRWLQAADWFEVFEELGRRDRWALTLEVFRWMQQQKWYRPDDGFYSKLISIMGKKGQIKLATRLFKEMRKHSCRPDSSVYNSLIAAHLRGKDKEVALVKSFGLYETMKKKARCQPNLVTYNILLRACAQVKETQKMSELLEEMSNAGIEPDVCTFNGILGAYGKAGAFLEIEDAMDQMRKAKRKPDFISFNTLIDAYGKAGHLTKMEEALKSMADARVSPQLSTFNSLINNYGNAGRIEEMEVAFRSMSGAGVTPSLITFEVMLKCYAKWGHVKEMRQFFHSMLKENVQPETTTLNTLMEGYCSQGMLDEAEELLDGAHHMGVEPKSSSFMILYESFTKHKCLEKLERLVKKSDVAGVRLKAKKDSQAVARHQAQPEIRNQENVPLGTDLCEPVISK